MITSGGASEGVKYSFLLLIANIYAVFVDFKSIAFLLIRALPNIKNAKNKALKTKCICTHLCAVY